jgi:hypothetical protein
VRYEAAIGNYCSDKNIIQFVAYFIWSRIGWH